VQRPEAIEDLFDENDQEEQFPEILKFQYPIEQKPTLEKTKN
jgi:hypothetical protein